MAKTTQKNDSTAVVKKPAARRPKATAPEAGAEKVTARRRTKSAPEAASAQEPAERSFGPEPTHDEIALRAWSIYESRGGGHGQAFDDWVEAKRQLYAERGLEG